MRLTPHVTERSQMSTKEQWRRDRAAAQLLQTLFPNVVSVSIELKFEDSECVPPAGQLHIMHPPANAFFEYLCPYTNCGGKFDLGPVARLLIGDSLARTSGTIECTGSRSRDGVTSPPCSVRLVYVMVAAYAPAAEPA